MCSQPFPACHQHSVRVFFLFVCVWGVFFLQPPTHDNLTWKVKRGMESSVEINIVKRPGSLPGVSIKMQEGRNHRAEPDQQVFPESPFSHEERTLQLQRRWPGCCCGGWPSRGRDRLGDRQGHDVGAWVLVFLDCLPSPPYSTFCHYKPSGCLNNVHCI